MKDKNIKSIIYKFIPAESGYLNFDFCILRFEFKR